MISKAGLFEIQILLFFINHWIVVGKQMSRGCKQEWKENKKKQGLFTIIKVDFPLSNRKALTGNRGVFMLGNLFVNTVQACFEIE